MKRFFVSLLLVSMLFSMTSIGFAKDYDDGRYSPPAPKPISTPVIVHKSKIIDPQFWLITKISTDTKYKNVSIGFEDEWKTDSDFATIEHSVTPFVSYWMKYGTATAGYKIDIDTAGASESAPMVEFSTCIGYFNSRTRLEYRSINSSETYRIREKLEIADNTKKFSPYGAVEFLGSEGGDTEFRYEGGVKTSLNKTWSGKAFYMLDVISGTPMSVFGAGISAKF